MEKTPKVPRKSLSLGSRLNSKRCSVSPQTRMRSVQSVAVPAVSMPSNSAEATTPQSPSLISISFDCGIDLTPPHKKFSLDDSLDYSPHTLDSSFSPSCMFSQTLAIDSPEVGWKWNRGRFDKSAKATIVTPDSAYTADSSFTSADSSSTEALSTARTRSDIQRQRKKIVDNRREEHRKALQIEQRKAEKLKMDELLTKRCVRLQEQLKETQRNIIPEKEETKTEQLSEPKEKVKVDNFSSAESIRAGSVAAPKALLNNISNVSIQDFFNDSESDGLLLEATQKLESQIVDLSQEKNISCSEKNTSADMLSKKSMFSSGGVATTPKSSCKEKQRSSFYAKFLEDDSTDDWFVALDDVALQDTAKPRTYFQRFKSMPIDTITTNAKASSLSRDSNKEHTTEMTSSKKLHKKDTAPEGVAKKLKRHASSNAFSPSSTSCRGPINSRKQ